MSFKNGGHKTKFIVSEGYNYEEYTIYCALESVSDVNSYVMVNSKGEREPIWIGGEDDTARGKYSLIDCLYYLKHHGSGTYDFSGYDDIVIEDMTSEELERYIIDYI